MIHRSASLRAACPLLVAGPDPPSNLEGEVENALKPGDERKFDSCLLGKIGLSSNHVLDAFLLSCRCSTGRVHTA
jgi:hypothetical protein